MNQCSIYVGGVLRCSLAEGHVGHHIHIDPETDHRGRHLATEAVPIDEVHVWERMPDLPPVAPRNNVVTFSTADQPESL